MPVQQRPKELQPARLPRRKTPVLHKAYTLFAILGAGLLAGALLGEASMMSFTLTFPKTLQSHSSGYVGNVNGYLIPADSRGQSRHRVSQPRAITAHHIGL